MVTRSARSTTAAAIFPVTLVITRVTTYTRRLLAARLLVAHLLVARLLAARLLAARLLVTRQHNRVIQFIKNMPVTWRLDANGVLNSLLATIAPLTTVCCFVFCFCFVVVSMVVKICVLLGSTILSSTAGSCGNATYSYECFGDCTWDWSRNVCRPRNCSDFYNVNDCASNSSCTSVGVYDDFLCYEKGLRLVDYWLRVISFDGFQ